ncbi:UNVERIFIED_CONTAM: hypothetical protein Sradi_2346600 [Sesamum radiatum]|uniref:CCHC-type domain-containing protein n=1 Tax=Sesamum radiatum TaxID=300843 RepID=A0AAW2T5I7_SESRA
MTYLTVLGAKYWSWRSSTCDKVYSMVMRVERQRKVHLEAIDTGINIVLYARNTDQDKNAGYKNFGKKKVVDKKLLTCASCGRTGHTRETCFKIHGVPNWYKELNEKKKKANGDGRAYMATEANKVIDTSGSSLIADLMEALKLIQNKGQNNLVKVHFAKFDEMTGMVFENNVGKHALSSWIVDTGATRHMCGDDKLLHL